MNWLDARPDWNPADKAASLRDFAEWLHKQAVGMFLEDGTHCQVLFLFTGEGLASVNPVPPGTGPDALLAGVRQAIREHGLYAVVTVAESWIYMPRSPRDHTAIQLLHGEMDVADLRREHRTEALMVRMESRDGGHLTWIDPILRSDGGVELGPGMLLPRGKCLKLEDYFEETS